MYILVVIIMSDLRWCGFTETLSPFTVTFSLAREMCVLHAYKKRWWVAR